MKAMQTAALVLLLLAIGCHTPREDPVPDPGTLSPARELLARSVRFHDPDGVWGTRPISFTWTSSRPNGDVGYVFHITMDPDGTFMMYGERRGSTLDYVVGANGEVWARVDGEEELTSEARDKMALGRDGGVFWRDYLGFLGVMPFNMQYESVEVAPDVVETKLMGTDVLAVRATFAPEVGTDIYTLYFDAETAQLVGCRFDRADPTRDGETIVYDGLIDASGVRLARTRRWFMNSDTRYIGRDDLSPDGR